MEINSASRRSRGEGGRITRYARNRRGDETASSAGDSKRQHCEYSEDVKHVTIIRKWKINYRGGGSNSQMSEYNGGRTGEAMKYFDRELSPCWQRWF